MPESLVSIHVLPTVSQLEVSHNKKEKSLLWTYNTWGNLKTSTTDIMFGIVNAFIASWSEEKQDALWDCYVEAHDTIETINEPEVTKAEIIDVVNKIESLFTFDQLKDWAMNNGLVPNPEDPVQNTTGNSDQINYLRDDIYDLTLYCFAAKIIMPIWGPYIPLISQQVGNAHKEWKSSRIFTESNFATWPPFERLQRYMQAFTAPRARKIPAALAYGIPVEDLPDVFIGYTLTRRLTIYPINNPKAPPLVPFIFKFLEGIVRTMANSDYMDKFNPDASSSDPESNSVTDQYRVSQNISDEKAALANLYFGYRAEPINYTKEGKPIDRSPWSKEERAGFLSALVRDVPELQGFELEIITIADQLEKDENFIVSPYIHTLIPGLIFRHHCSPILHEHMCARARWNAIAAASIYCRQMGLTDVASLLIAGQRLKDARVMNMEDQSGILVRKMSNELNQQLMDCYPHRSPFDVKHKTNKGKQAIERIISEVRQNNWDGLESTEELNNSLARLFIEAGRQPQ